MSVVEGNTRFVDPDSFPPKPIYVLRGHTAEITSLRFIRNNARLISGYRAKLDPFFNSSDADGWVVLWDMASRRPSAVWKAHDASVLSIRDWNGNKLITNGREGKVFVWKLQDEDEVTLETGVPGDGGPRRKPWLLHSLDVKEMTFCGVDVAFVNQDALIATSSGGLGDLIDVYSLPSKTMFCKDIGKNPPEKLGMTMCLSLTSKDDDPTQFTLVAGYESGRVCVYILSSSSWSRVYSVKAHTQPVLSLALHPDKESFYTSAADANIVHHPIAITTQPIKVAATKHAGQTELAVRDDGRVLVTAGWDGVGRVYSGRSLRQVAVLKWHAGGLQASEFSGSVHGKRLIVLGGKDGKISLWDAFN